MTTRKPLIAGNWKMFKTGPEAAETASRLKDLVSDAADVDIMVAPPFTAIAVVKEVLGDSFIHVGGQDLFWEVEGAYTGQISAPMLKAAGCTHVIIGHSERRQFFGGDQRLSEQEGPGCTLGRPDPCGVCGRI